MACCVKFIISQWCSKVASHQHLFQRPLNFSVICPLASHLFFNKSLLSTKSTSRLSIIEAKEYHTSLVSRARNGSEKVSKGSKSSEEHHSVLMQFVDKKEQPKAVTVGAKVVQAGKDVSYLLVILAGFAVTGFLFWSVGSEFFMSDSPSTIFTKALKRVKADPRVIEALGEPITGHGEMSGRGRRRDIAHQEYIVDGVLYMRVKFYLDGSKRKGTAYLDLKKNDSGKYECRFLFVELKGYPGGTIVLEDNR